MVIRDMAQFYIRSVDVQTTVDTQLQLADFEERIQIE